MSQSCCPALESVWIFLANNAVKSTVRTMLPAGTNEDGNTQYQVRWRDVGPEWDSWEWEDQQNPSDKLWRNAKKKWEKLRGKKSPEALEAEMNAAI